MNSNWFKLVMKRIKIKTERTLNRNYKLCTKRCQFISEEGRYGI